MAEQTTDPATSATDDGPPTVLAVDDDDDVRLTYELWLDESWEVRTAADGSEALDQLDDSVDVVILDRMMPGLSGEEVLEELRSRDIDARVAMVTAVNPGVDIVEMPFDAYFTKPVDREELNETVETLVERSRHDQRLQEYYSLVEKRATLEAELPEQTLRSDERYHALVDRIRELQRELEAEIVELDQEEFVALVDDVV